VPDFDTAYDEHFAFVWRTARRMGVPEDYDERAPFTRWLFRIITRVVADHRRTYWRKQSRV
jgi:hypothetical protein